MGGGEPLSLQKRKPPKQFPTALYTRKSPTRSRPQACWRSARAAMARKWQKSKNHFRLAFHGRQQTTDTLLQLLRDVLTLPPIRAVGIQNTEKPEHVEGAEGVRRIQKTEPERLQSLSAASAGTIAVCSCSNTRHARWEWHVGGLPLCWLSKFAPGFTASTS